MVRLRCSDGRKEKVKRRMVRLRCSDGRKFKVEERLARWSQTIADILDSGCDGEVIPLPNVSGPIFSKVINYCRHHADAAENTSHNTALSLAREIYFARGLRTFDEEFVDVDQDTLFDILLAADYLEVESLMELTCNAVANRMEKRSPEQICKIFNIKTDYTKEEEDTIRREHRWAFKHI